MSEAETRIISSTIPITPIAPNRAPILPVNLAIIVILAVLYLLIAYWCGWEWNPWYWVFERTNGWDKAALEKIQKWDKVALKTTQGYLPERIKNL